MSLVTGGLGGGGAMVAYGLDNAIAVPAVGGIPDGMHIRTSTSRRAIRPVPQRFLERAEIVIAFTLDADGFVVAVSPAEVGAATSPSTPGAQVHTTVQATIVLSSPDQVTYVQTHSGALATVAMRGTSQELLDLSADRALLGLGLEESELFGID